MTPLPPLPEPEVRRKLRDAMGITLKEAAAEIRVSPRSYLRWEWGDAQPVPRNHRRYAAQLESWQHAIDAT